MAHQRVWCRLRYHDMGSNAVAPAGGGGILENKRVSNLRAYWKDNPERYRLHLLVRGFARGLGRTKEIPSALTNEAR